VAVGSTLRPIFDYFSSGSLAAACFISKVSQGTMFVKFDFFLLGCFDYLLNTNTAVVYFIGQGQEIDIQQFCLYLGRPGLWHNE